MNNIRIEVTNPGEVVLTLTATAKLSEWKEIQKQLKDKQFENYDGSWVFAGIIDELIDKASKSFYPNLNE